MSTPNFWGVSSLRNVLYWMYRVRQFSPPPYPERDKIMTNQFSEQTTLELIEGAYSEDAQIKLRDAQSDGVFLSNKELNSRLPQVFLRDGRIRKNPDASMPRSVESIAGRIKAAERTRREVVEEKNDLIIHGAFGSLMVMGDIRDVIVASDLFAELFIKGWTCTTKAW